MHQPNLIPPPTASPLAVEQMRREFRTLNVAPKQQFLPRQPNSTKWASEFKPGTMETAMPRAEIFNRRDFEGFPQANEPLPQSNGSAISNGPVGMNYQPTAIGMGGMGYNGGAMGMGMGMHPMVEHPFTGTSSQLLNGNESKGKGRMVELDEKDWEAQFAQLETPDANHQDASALDEEANLAMEAELANFDRSVSSTSQSILDQETEAIKDRLPDFEAIWRNISAELPRTHRTFAEDELRPDGREHVNGMDDFPDFASDFHLNTHISDPQLDDYMFEQDNIFSGVGDPFGEGVRIMDEGGNLSLAALAFEAAVQKDPQHIDAWVRLGASQAQNEKEVPAIRALEHARNLDPSNLEAMMGLAVSYTNEGYETTAYRMLGRWLCTKYPQLDPSFAQQLAANPGEIGAKDHKILHERITDLFIRAAQLSPDPATMDPDVQVGLGVLFYGAEQYDKAVDCFGAALASSEDGSTNSAKANQRPLLWNRLGATLANSGRSEEAIDAYERALELNPNFVRARYNLGVSCINIQCLPEAAQHLLGALDMHKMVEREGREKAQEIVDGVIPDEANLDRLIGMNESTNLHETLKRVFRNMKRQDLVDRVKPGMDPASFRGEFEF